MYFSPLITCTNLQEPDEFEIAVVYHIEAQSSIHLNKYIKNKAKRESLPRKNWSLLIVLSLLKYSLQISPC